jgi:nucleotide-binding universal stress UspA family protein
VREVLQLEDRVIYLDELVQQERASWHRYLVRQGSQLAFDGVVVRWEICFGDPAAEILAAAERHAVHLIALVGQQQSWLQRLTRPSLAQQLLTQSRVPVLVVPPGSSPAGGLVLRYSRMQV